MKALKFFVLALPIVLIISLFYVLSDEPPGIAEPTLLNWPGTSAEVFDRIAMNRGFDARVAKICTDPAHAKDTLTDAVSEPTVSGGTLVIQCNSFGYWKLTRYDSLGRSEFTAIGTPGGKRWKLIVSTHVADTQDVKAVDCFFISWVPQPWEAIPGGALYEHREWDEQERMTEWYCFGDGSCTAPTSRRT